MIDGIDGMQITLGATAVAVMFKVVTRVFDLLERWLWGRNAGMEIKGQPIRVAGKIEHEKDCVTREECRDCVKKHDDVIKQIFQRINDKDARDASVQTAMSAQLGELKGLVEASVKSNESQSKLYENITKILMEKMK